MKGRKPFLSLVVGVLSCAIMAGCAGSIPQNGPSALNIAQFTVNNGVIGISYKFLLVASGGVHPYTWTIDAGSLPPGLSLTTDGIIEGTPTQVGTFNFTAKVTDSQTPTKAYNTLKTSITINPVLGLTTQTLPVGLVGSGYNGTIRATNGLPPYQFTLADPDNQPLPDGLTLTSALDPNGGPDIGSIKGTPTTAGVYTFPVQVTDALSENATATFTITVKGRLDGPYVLYFNGFDNGQPFYEVAQLVASDDVSGAGVINGVLDQVGPGSTTLVSEAVTGTYNVGENSNFGSLTFTTTTTQVTYNLAMIVSSAGDSKVILNNTSESDSAYGSGLLKKQTNTTLLGGVASYAFGAFGNDVSGGRYAGAGMFALAASVNGSQTVTGGEQDTNDNGTIGSQVSFTGGSLLSSDATTGRGTYSLTTSSATSNFTYYIVSPTEIVALQTDAGGPLALVDLQQQQNAGASGVFTNASLTGQSVVSLDGIANSISPTTPSAAVGVVAFDGNGNIVGPTACDSTVLPGYYTDQSDGGNLSTVQYNAGTYNVDATCGVLTQACGRVTVNLSGAPTQPVWYLSAPNQAFAVDTNPGVMAGTLQIQNVPQPKCDASPPKLPFNIGAVLGSYLGVTLTPATPEITNEVDVAITPPNPNKPLWEQKFDSSGPFGQASQFPFTGSFNCGDTVPACSDYGAYFGRFTVTGPGDASNSISILYVLGSASSGITGSKGGIMGLNVGQQSDGTVDPNPRITQYSR
jgi:putative Ig domain-containing protein